MRSNKIQPYSKTIGSLFARLLSWAWKSVQKADGTFYLLAFPRSFSILKGVLSVRLGNAQPDRETWKKAYEYYVQAFHAPVKDTEKKRLTRVLKKPVSKEVVEWFFDYDAFLRGLGRMSLSKCSSDSHFG